MAQTTSRPRHDILGALESALDDNAEYIGESVWKALHNAYETIDGDVMDLQSELDEAHSTITSLEERIQELEASQ